MFFWEETLLNPSHTTSARLRQAQAVTQASRQLSPRVIATLPRNNFSTAGCAPFTPASYTVSACSPSKERCHSASSHLRGLRRYLSDLVSPASSARLTARPASEPLPDTCQFNWQTDKTADSTFHVAQRLQTCSCLPSGDTSPTQPGWTGRALSSQSAENDLRTSNLLIYLCKDDGDNALLVRVHARS
jgi:hypothetical protein